MSLFSSASSRPLPVRMRGDLVVRAPSLEDPAYVIKDPITLKHFQLLPEEYSLLCWLDGKRSPLDLKQIFEKQFAPARLSLSRLQILIAQFARDGLVLSDQPGIGRQLYEKQVSQAALDWREKWGNPLAARFRGINPDSFLTWLHRKLGWVFHPVWLYVCLSLILSAPLWIVLHFQSFLDRLDEFAFLQQPSNVLWLVLTLSCMKVIHELAHGLTCKHFGGECHELGVMLLVFSPCLYCNVSDAWMIRQRHHRVAVAAAGMYAEAVMASVCFWLWWFSHPGLLHTLCMNVMVVCSIGTFVFNANPLLRYDGYFMLSDWFRQPNLWQVSQAFIKAKLQWICLGWKTPIAHHQRWNALALTAYGLASWMYRVVVFTGIVFFLYQTLRQWHFNNVANLFLYGMLSAVALGPVHGSVQSLRRPLRPRIRKRHLFLTASAMAIGLVAIFGIPLPTYVEGPALYRMAHSEPVLVVVPGSIVSTAKIGSEVKQGDVLCQLRSLDIERQQAQLRGERNQLAAELEQLETYQGSDPELANRIPAVREQLKGIEAAWERVEANASQLTLRAGQAGMVIAPREQTMDRGNHDVTLTSWQGSPLQSSNRGAWLERGTLVCEIGNPRSLEAMVYVTVSDAARIRPGQTVEARPAQAMGKRLRGEVLEVSDGPIQEIPQDLFVRQQFAYRADAHGKLMAEEPLYEVRISLGASDEVLTQHECGDARIRVASQTLYQRVRLWLHDTFAE